MPQTASKTHRDAPWMETHNTSSHTHTHLKHTHHTHLRGRHPAICFTCFLSSCSTSVLSLSLPLLFFPPRTPPPFFFSLSLFLSLFFSHRAAARGEERRGHRQVAYAPSSGLFYVLTRTEDGCPGGETTPPPSTPSTHSLTSCFSHSSSLFFPLGRKSSMFYCLSFSSFWHSHISKLLLPTLSHTSGSVKSQFVWQQLKRFHIVLWVLLFCLFFHRRPNCTEVHYGVQKYEGSEEKKEIGRRLSAACLLTEVSGVM